MPSQGSKPAKDFSTAPTIPLTDLVHLSLPCESCQLYAIVFRGTKSAPREPRQDPRSPPKIYRLLSSAEFSHNMAWPVPRNVPSQLLPKPLLIRIGKGHRTEQVTRSILGEGHFLDPQFYFGIQSTTITSVSV
jgi:hypothetical protein